MTSNLRKFVLTAHVTFSIGWFGAVAGFLALAITGLISSDIQIIRAVYIAMELTGWFVIVPACLASLLTGLIQSLGTPWGLFKHYWIAIKFILTVVSTLVLFLHMQPISYLSKMAYQGIISNPDLRGLRIQLIADSGAALLVLLVAITLSIYKPWGKTPYGLPQQSMRNEIRRKPKSWGLYILLGLICLVIFLFILFHAFGGGLGHH